MIIEDDGNTGSESTAGATIYDAAARIRELREKGQSQPSNDGTGDEAPDPNARAAEDAGDNGPDELNDDPTGDGTGEAEGDDGTTSPDGEGTNVPDDKGFVLNSWTPKQLDQKIKLKVGDELIETTVREAFRGHMRQTDYTRKTEELNRTRDSFIAERTRYGEVLAVLEPIIEQSIGGRTEEEWNALRDEDPQAYLLAREEYAQAKERIEAARDERKRVHQEEQREILVKHTERLEGESKKFDAAFKIPPGDRTKRLEIVKANCDYLRSMGMTDGDINTIFDHRAFVLIDKARRFDKIEADRKAAEKTRNPNPAPMKSGAGVQTQQRTTGKEIVAKKAEAQLKKSGSVRDAAALIRARREAGR